MEDTVMDTIAAFLNATSNLSVTFAIERRFVRELPKRPATPVQQPSQKKNVITVQEKVSMKQLPDELIAARFWLPRAYYKPVENSNTDVSAIFHFVKCDKAPAPHDIQSERLFRIFRNLCLTDNYRLKLFQYEDEGQYGLLCLP